ncbi:aminopeptidase N-like [Camponotus floridanus]|uniref:aminopeptidase N-like n=1 Tax=Camponotus floridanus TaxID=104421 RepID=UPI000DC68D12|nr:aminopeptidase N-like [Camponotus floridanus]
MFLKLLLSSSLTIIVAAVFLTDDQIIKISQAEINRHSNYILPYRYDIIVTHIEENILVCHCIIRTEIIHPTSSILLYLHVKNISLTVVYYPNYYSNNDIEEKNIYASIKSMYDVKKNIVKYIFADYLWPGYYIIKLVYNITEDTGLKTFYKRDGRQWLATYVDCIGIQHMIPSLPEPLSAIFQKPMYEIIVEDYENYTVFSNEPIQKIERNDKNMTLIHTLVKPIYLLFLTNRNNLSRMPGTNKSVRVNMWCRMHCEFAHQFAEHITSYLFDKWKRLNKTWEINHIALPDFRNESIINLGLILYGEADIIYNDNVDFVATKIKVAYFIAHKIIQECFYYENPLWPLSSLLNEAIVAFFGLYVTNQTLPSTRIMDLFVIQSQQESLHFDTEYNTSLYNTLFNISFEHYSYIKVYSVLRILQEMITEEIFWQSIRIYVKDNNSTFNYFGEIMKNLSYTQISTDNLYIIRQLINSTIQRNYYPVVNVVKMKININLNEMMMMLDDYISYDMVLGDFIVFNLNQTGYYRVNYDIENWRRLVSYLNSENYRKIHVLNRARIIDDAFHLMITNQLNSTVFWSITKYLSRETDYVAWYPMFKALEYLSNIFLFQEKIYSNIKEKMLYLLNNLLIKLKYDEVSNEYDLTKSLRMEAAKWACNLNSETCIKNARLNLNRHLEDPENNTLLPWWKEWTYCQGLKILYYPLSYESMEDSPWWKVYRLGKEKFKTKFLKYLSCPEDSIFIIPYLNLIKNDSTTSIMFFKDFSDKDYINYFLFTIAKHARNPVVLDFILEELENIRPRQISEYATFIVIINHVYSTNELQKISNLLRDKFVNVTQAELNECKELRFFVKERITKVKTSNLTQSADYFGFIQQNTSNIESKIQMQYILNIESKIQMRFFEIKSQQNYFQNFVKYPEGGFFQKSNASKKLVPFWLCLVFGYTSTCE